MACRDGDFRTRRAFLLNLHDCSAIYPLPRHLTVAAANARPLDFHIGKILTHPIAQHFTQSKQNPATKIKEHNNLNDDCQLSKTLKTIAALENMLKKQIVNANTNLQYANHSCFCNTECRECTQTAFRNNRC